MAANKFFHTGREGLEFKNKERVYPTGCRLFNTALGIFDPVTGLPGIRKGSIVEAFGPNASLKTALWESLAGNIHSLTPKGRILAIMPEEPDYNRFVSQGIDIDRIDCWTYYNPNNPEEIISAEEGLNMALAAVQDITNNYELVVIDSLKGLMSMGEVFDKKGQLKELEVNDPVAARARLCNKFFGNWVVYNKSRAILFFTNQHTDYIGNNFMLGSTFKTPTSGGNAKNHWADVRVECNSTVPDQTEKPEEQGLFKNKIYDRIKPIYYLQKNKYGYPFRKVISDFSLTEKRYLNENNCLAVAEFLGLVEKKGNAHWIVDGKTIQGKDKARQYLHENQNYQNELWKQIDARHEEFFGAGKKSSKEGLDE